MAVRQETADGAETVFPFECAPFNLRTEAALAFWFAGALGWLAADTPEDGDGIMEYRLVETVAKCGFGNGSFQLWAEHDFVTDEQEMTITYEQDLDIALFHGLRLKVALKLAPVYLGPGSQRQFGAKIEDCRLNFIAFEKSLEVAWVGDALVISEIKGKGEKPRVEVLFNAGKWQSETKKKSFGELFNPEVAKAPRWIWLSVVNRAMAGELTGQGPNLTVTAMIEKTLLERTAIVSAVLGK